MKRTITLVSILVLLLLSAGGTACESGSTTQPTPSPTPSPSPSTASWHDVTTFSGSSDKTTNPFTIQGERFRLTWTVTPDPDAVDFDIGGDLYIYVYPEGETVMYVESVMAMGNMTTTSDTTNIYEGPGSFYLAVTVANVATWEVKVESYH